MGQERVFAIFGIGTFGFEVCKVLAERGGKVIAIDHKSDVIEKIKDIVTQAILIDSTDEDALKNIDLEGIDIALVAIGNNMQASILTTALLKKLGVPYIIARAITDIHSRVLKQIGASEVINIEIDEGREVANRLISPDILERIPISKNQTLAEVIVPKSFIGKTLMALDMRKKFNINVISVKRKHEEIDGMGNPQSEEVVFTPNPTEVLRHNDVLVVVGSDQEIDALKEF